MDGCQEGYRSHGSCRVKPQRFSNPLKRVASATPFLLVGLHANCTHVNPFT